jgi:glucosamine--fructose-6-phosphate aminotransferase (isomerizing)
MEQSFDVTDSTNPMRDQILATPAALQAGFAELELRARLVLETPEIYRIRRIVLIGSGDSYFAAKAAEMAFLTHSGLPVEVRTPLEAGCYHAMLSAGRDLENMLVIALSNSGAAARVCEAARLYRAAGAKVLAVTKAAEGRLAGVADKALIVPVPALPSAPGFGPYLFAFVALILLAMRIGEVRMGMTMDEAQALRKALLGHFDDLDSVIVATDGAARGVAEAISGKTLLEFTGGGPNLATAEYGAAKILEAAGRHAVARDLEEWTHLNYFDGAPAEIATIIALPPESRAASRATELLAYMEKLGRLVVIVGGGPMAERGSGQGRAVLTVAPAIAEIWSPLLLSAPVALIAAHLAELTRAQYGRGGKGAWEDSADAGTVQQSQFWEPGA